MRVEETKVIDDSMLVVNRSIDRCEIRVDKLKIYYDYLKIVIKKFEKCSFIFMLRLKNQMTNALASVTVLYEKDKSSLMKSLVIVST